VVGQVDESDHGSALQRTLTNRGEERRLLSGVLLMYRVGDALSKCLE